MKTWNFYSLSSISFHLCFGPPIVPVIFFSNYFSFALMQLTQQTFALMKTSWRRLSSSSSEDLLIKTNIFVLLTRLQKTSPRRLQDVLVKTNIFVLARRLEDIFKTFWRRLQDVFKTSCQDGFKTFWRRLQDVFKTCCKNIFKTFWRRLQDINRTSKQNESFCRSSHPKGSLKKVSWEISQNSQKNPVCTRSYFLIK